jgi:hypothetical protein
MFVNIVPRTHPDCKAGELAEGFTPNGNGPHSVVASRPAFGAANKKARKKKTLRAYNGLLCLQIVKNERVTAFP